MSRACKFYEEKWRGIKCGEAWVQDGQERVLWGWHLNRGPGENEAAKRMSGERIIQAEKWTSAHASDFGNRVSDGGKSGDKAEARLHRAVAHGEDAEFDSLNVIEFLPLLLQYGYNTAYLALLSYWWKYFKCFSYEDHKTHPCLIFMHMGIVLQVVFLE